MFYCVSVQHDLWSGARPYRFEIANERKLSERGRADKQNIFCLRAQECSTRLHHYKLAFAPRPCPSNRGSAEIFRKVIPVRGPVFAAVRHR